MTNVDIARNSNENNLGLLRRFSRKVQSSGVIPRVRSKRYSERILSSYKIKRIALKKLTKKAQITELIKLGKIVAKTKRGR